MSITYHSIIFNKIAKTYIHILMWPSWSWPVFIPLNVEEEGNLITNWSNLTTFTGLFSLKREIWFVICISLYTKMMAALQIERDMSIFSWMFNKKKKLYELLYLIACQWSVKAMAELLSQTKDLSIRERNRTILIRKPNLLKYIVVTNNND